MRGDGDGWATSEDGSRYWGRFGAAGLLLRAPAPDGGSAVLLQHRAQWSHQGGTWALPGGARDSHESTTHAAVREAEEEAGIAAASVRVRAERVTARAEGGWTYTTVVADAETALATVPNGESTELRWVPEDRVEDLPLHPGFAASWPALRAAPVRLLLDTANVLGSRPNGWWRDRAGATGELLAALAGTLPRIIELPDGSFGWLPRVEAVLEGKASAVAGVDARVPVHVASGSGDDALAQLASSRPASATLTGVAGELTAVVTADRGLRDRLPESVLRLSPSTVLSWLD
ncbi:NUDIX domain-containing protein [Rhodococcus spelaei]|uniref:NUDIX domain-containing protein n=1 Tax=Rhodococcus spelaei TaxID=2546320 RepID=A0A541BAN5_9NOCA|nr:NUDIX domain-containing protein [Rhodococcus spelaei]TQF69343.1 NUDIX domain-containing protein [Rhodococcus spelaei]